MTRSRFASRVTLAFGTVTLCALAAALLLAGCGGSSPSSSSSSPGATGSGTVTLWHGYTDVERTAIDRTVVEYNATNPAWKASAVFAGNNDYALTKLQTALAARRR